MNNQNCEDECGTGDMNTIKHQYLKVSNPKYAIHDNRMKSFKSWPNGYSYYQIQNLCDAGFYYTGISDKIQCFLCGVRLSNWNDSEIPLDQHIVWAPNCTLLKILKGKEYIEDIRKKFVIKSDD